MRFIPRSVMVGFVNALAILMFLAQLPYLTGVSWHVYAMVARRPGDHGLPAQAHHRRARPARRHRHPHDGDGHAISLPDVADQGELPDSLPTLFLPDVPLTMETLQIIGPFAVAMALVGLKESLMTAKLVDDVTDTHSNKTREVWGQGVANIITGFFGGMGGCAMIGQTMINVKVSRARTRISTFLAGVFLLILVVGFAAVMFVNRVAHFTQVIDVAQPDEDTRVYAVVGELFWASSNDLVYQFDYTGDPQNVVIDMSRSHIWDASTVATLDAITSKDAARGNSVTITGLNEASAERHQRLAAHLGGD